MKRMRYIMVLTLLLLTPQALFADFSPTAYYIVNGDAMESTDAITDAQAPLEVTFKANPTNLPVDMTPSYEWRFTKNGETEPFLRRYEMNTVYDFRESGTFDVALYVALDTENEADIVATIRITISTSLLEMPNAFSPNGDGINDIYKAKDNHRSIVDFHAYIFNRWGQKLYEWTDINGGWDGTHKGTPVKDGVYYVLVKAKGADGREYNIRRDVNILRKYSEAAGGVE